MRMRRSGEEKQATVRWSSLTITDCWTKIGRIVEPRGAARVGPKPVIDLAAVAGVDEFDDRLELDVGDHPKDHEDTDSDQATAYDPAREPDDAQGRTSSADFGFAFLCTVHRNATCSYLDLRAR
jgi:hypothetical protein